LHAHLDWRTPHFRGDHSQTQRIEKKVRRGTRFAGDMIVPN
jgi:hypothetical protein